MGLIEKIRDGRAKAGVVGLGYVGLPLAVEIAESGLEVVGIDVQPKKVEAINAGRSYILDVPSERVAALVREKRLSATSDYARVAELDTINVCVPTPLRKTREPDLSFIVDSLRAMAPHMRSEQLLILENTTYPGTTEEILVPILEEVGRRPGRDVEVAFSPERTDPGNRLFDTRSIPKVVGGCTPRASAAARALYGRCIDKVVMVSSPRGVADLATMGAGREIKSAFVFFISPPWNAIIKRRPKVTVALPLFSAHRCQCNFSLQRRFGVRCAIAITGSILPASWCRSAALGCSRWR